MEQSNFDRAKGDSLKQWFDLRGIEIDSGCKAITVGEKWDLILNTFMK